MKKLENVQMERVKGGDKTDVKAFFVCGVAVGLSVVVGVASGGIGFVAMMGGAAAPACAAAVGSIWIL